MTKRAATTKHLHAGPSRVTATKVAVALDPAVQDAAKRLDGHKSLLLRLSPERRAQLRALEGQELSGPAEYEE